MDSRTAQRTAEAIAILVAAMLLLAALIVWTHRG